MRTLFIRWAVWIALAVFWGATALCPSGANGRALPAQAATHFAIGDFDGDNRPDLASVDVGQSNARTTRYWIAFRLSGGSGHTVGITAPAGGVQIASRDVNGDNFPDVIVTTAWTDQPVAVLLNDGFGNFTPSDPGEFPSAFTTPEGSWTFATDEIRDATAALFWRCVSGDCHAGARSWSPSKAAWLHAAAPGRPSNSPSILPCSGRAPPAIKI